MKPMIGGECTTPKYGLFFGGCAWGCAYYIGVVRAAREKWVSGMNRVQTHIPVGGSSAGALIALGVALDKTDAEMSQMYYDLATQARKHGVLGSMSKYHQAVLDRWIPLGGSEWSELMQTRRLHIGLTRFPATPVLVGSWSSNKHLQELLHASFHIPIYCEHTVRGHFMDGALVRSFWQLPSAQTTWAVSPIQPAADICPSPTMSLFKVVWPLSEPDLTSSIARGDLDFRRMCHDNPKGCWRRYGTKSLIRTLLRYLITAWCWTLFYGRRPWKNVCMLYAFNRLLKRMHILVPIYIASLRLVCPN